MRGICFCATYMCFHFNFSKYNISYSLKKNREKQPKERFPSEPSQENEDRQKVLIQLNEQLDRISGEEMRQLLEFLKQNEDRNIFQDLENNN